MLLFKNIFSLTRQPTNNLFSQSHGSSFEYRKNVSSFENQKRARKKFVYMKSENIGHHQQYSQLKAMQFQHGNGIGIVKLLEGKNILITGATGFLAKGIIYTYNINIFLTRFVNYNQYYTSFFLILCDKF